MGYPHCPFFGIVLVVSLNAPSMVNAQPLLSPSLFLNLSVIETLFFHKILKTVKLRPCLDKKHFGS
jgi:hypothetical protein